MSDIKYTNNSLSTLMHDLIKLTNNNLSVINALSTLTASKKNTVELKLTDENNDLISVLLPSYNAIQNHIDRLDINVKNLSNISGDSRALLTLPDGSQRTILTNRLKTEAANITSLNSPNEFHTKDNWFFESFLDPMMFIRYDVTSQVDPSTERVMIRRYILNTTTKDQKNLFNEKFKNISSIEHSEFLNKLMEYGITYYTDESTEDIPPRTKRFYGNFSVSKTFSGTETTDIADERIEQNVLKVRLDKLTYSDRNSEFTDTRQLSIGDSLVVNKNYNTRYTITNIDTGKNTISLRLLEGFEPIVVGDGELSYYNEQDIRTYVDVGIGFNERNVVFIKPIDPVSKIASTQWSPGSGFYSNELTIEGDDGEQINLDAFYKNSVIDFGAYMFSIVKEKIPPSILGVIPNTPSTIADNFKVVQINKHLTDIPEAQTIIKLHEQKQALDADIKDITTTINKKRSIISTKRYNSAVEKDAANKELNSLVDTKTNKTKEFASTVSKITATSRPGSQLRARPKYRVRGFWPIPIPKESDKTRDQEVIQFAIQFRYLTRTGGANKPDQFTFLDVNDETRQGSFSNWTESKTGIRKRVKDNASGEFVWVIEDVENSNVTNINQLDIPIQKGEDIEIRIKSISEAGWPNNPLESSWSDVVKVSFPDSIGDVNDIDAIILDAQTGELKVQFEESLEEKGVNSHVADSFTYNDKLYNHTANSIASGFVTDADTPVSLYEKLVQMENIIDALNDQINDVRGLIVIKIIDDEGQEIIVDANSEISIFAGNYKDQVENLSVKKGVIIQKNFFIKIINTASTDLELYSRLSGSKLERAQASYGSGTGFDANEIDYNTKRRYDIAPLGLSNPDTDDIAAYQFISQIPNQSAQSKSQFIYSRYMTVDNINRLYTEIDASNTNGDLLLSAVFGSGIVSSANDIEYFWNPTPSGIAGSSVADYIWVGPSESDVITAASNEYSTNNQIDVHVDHPSIPSWAAAGLVSIPMAEVRMSKYGPLENTSIDGKTQAAYYTDPSSNDSIKIAFTENDQYTLGPYSVGSYMFLGPKDHQLLAVDGSNALANKLISSGNDNAINIPLIFQYRMTDYSGQGNSGIGNIGGDSSGTTKQLAFSKIMGFDIYYDRDQVFSFDVKITAKYRSESLSISDIPTRRIENAIDDINVNPSIIN